MHIGYIYKHTKICINALSHTHTHDAGLQWEVYIHTHAHTPLHTHTHVHTQRHSYAHSDADIAKHGPLLWGGYDE